MKDQFALDMMVTIRQAALDESERETVRKICEWLRSPVMNAPSVADAIERGEWKK